jgi:hypothetical protein
MDPIRPDPNASAAEAAGYVAEITQALAVIVRQHGLETLAYILDMASLEARHEAETADAFRRRAVE